MSDLRSEIVGQQFGDTKEAEGFGGRKVVVRQMGPGGFQRLRAALRQADGWHTADISNLTAVHLVYECACDPETGKRLFQGEADLEWLMEQHGSAFEDIALAAARVNGMGEAGDDAAEAQDELEGNS